MFPKPARSLIKYFPLFEKQKKKVVLDYGSGNLRNSLFLHRRGYDVYAVDLPYRIKFNSLPRLKFIWPEDLQTLNKKINLAICTFVLNLIDASQRSEAIKKIARQMTPGGYLLIETKGFLLTEIDRLVIPRGFIRVHSQGGRYTVIALYQYIGPQD